jgi:serine/threonine protein kinase
MQRIGPYEVQEEIGRGGMGVVYRAVDPYIGRSVAVKVIRLGDISDPEEQEQLRGRLFREARAAGILKHGGIVTIHYVGEEQGVAFIAMEYVSGPTLEKLLLAEIPLDKERIRQILRETAAALDYAHRKGIIHRDVKPANIMLEEEETVKICDFGIAKGFTGLSSMTQTGMAIGTPYYMPPEQIQGKVVDAHADQYALAVIAFQMLTGQRPFQADSIQTLFYRIMVEPPEAAHKLNPSLPEAVAEVFDRALAKEPSNRYATCREFVATLLNTCDTRPDWSPLPRRGLAGSGSTPGRSSKPIAPVVAPAPVPTPVATPPRPVEPAPALPAEGWTAPQAEPGKEHFTPVLPDQGPPPKPAEERCRNCGGAVQPGVELCAFCASFAATVPPLSGLEELHAQEPRAPYSVEPTAAEVAGSTAGDQDDAAGVGFTTAFADVLRVETPPPASVSPEQEKPSEEDKAPAGFTEAFADVLAAEAPSPGGVAAEEEKSSEETDARSQAPAEPAVTPGPALDRGTPAGPDMWSEPLDWGSPSGTTPAGVAPPSPEMPEASSQRTPPEQPGGEVPEQTAEAEAQQKPAGGARSAEPGAPTLPGQPAQYEEPGAVVSGFKLRLPVPPKKFYIAGGAALLTLVVAIGISTGTRRKPRPPLILRPQKGELSFKAADQAGFSPRSPASPVEITKVGGIGARSGQEMPSAGKPQSATTIEKPATEPLRSQSRTNEPKVLPPAEDPESAAWHQLDMSRDPASLRRFLDRFPTGAHHAAAQQRLDEVEWESIDQQDPSALEEFARRYPQNPHVSYAITEAARISRSRETAQVREQVRRTLAALSEAIGQRDETQLRAIWPTIPARTLDDWKSAFKNGRSIEMQLRPRGEPDISGSTARVDCDSTTRKVYSESTQVYTTAAIMHVTLHKQGNNWVIESMR